jgi:hypothetical protein
MVLPPPSDQIIGDVEIARQTSLLACAGQRKGPVIGDRNSIVSNPGLPATHCG